MSIVRKAGTTDVSVVIRIIDSTDGTPETGVTSATSGLALEYRREGATSTAITESDLTNLNDAHSDGGMKHIGNGYYRLDLPDAACASGVPGVLVHGTATGMVVIGEYVQLVAYDPFDTVRLGLTALPNAAADAAGGLPISDAGGLDLDAQVGTKIDSILADTGTDGVVLAANSVSSTAIANDAITAAKIAAGAIDAATFAADVDAEILSYIVDDATRIDASALNTAAGTTIPAIVADTNELQTDWANGGRLDLILDARASQTSVDDLPTNAELSTALAAADDATLAAIAALNNLSSAQAQTAAAAALTAYDPPTNTEMEARTLPAASYATASGVSAVETDTQNIQTRLPDALTAGGNMKSDSLAISGSTESADRLERSTLGIVTGTIGSGSTTTSLAASALSAASSVNDQFNGRIITFDKDTTTAALRGQSTDITDFVHSTQTFTVTALTNAPVSGDTFVIT